MIKCTVAIPVYNRKDFIMQAIHSVLIQNVPDMEILVVDNFSDDGTWELLQSCVDSRLRIYQNEKNIGIVSNFEKCRSLARGKYLRFLCSDDRLAPDCLKKEIEIMDLFPNVAMLSTSGRLIDKNGNVLKTIANYYRPGVYGGEEAINAWFLFFAQYGLNMFNYPSGVLFRSKLLNQIENFEIALSGLKAAGDIELFFRMLRQGDMAVINSLGCDIYVHDDQMGTNVRKVGDAIKDIYTLIERYKSILKKMGTSYDRVFSRISAISLGCAFKSWLKGDREVCKLFWGLSVRKESSFIIRCIICIHVCILRFMLRKTGIVFTSMRQIQDFSLLLANQGREH